MRYLLTFSLVLVLGSQVLAKGPSVEELETVNVKALGINLELRDLYARSINTKRADKNEIALLNAQLAELQALHARIIDASNAQGIGIDRIVLSTRRFRSLAWLHAWTAFNQLVYRASGPPVDPSLRRSLISMAGDGTSSLELLLATYSQIAETENNQVNPLQAVLADNDQLSHLLAYREAWLNSSEQSKSGVNHEFYIPSSEDILGKSNDMITGGKIPRNLLSFWGLVNLELDTWHNNALNPETGPVLPASLNARQLGSSDLASWLMRVDASPLKYPGSTDAVSGFRVRAKKLGLFLNWRQKYSDEDELAKLIDGLFDARTKPGGNLAVSFGDLLEAAKPVDGESLYDAGYWARYVYLLSIKMPRRSLQTPAQLSLVEDKWRVLGLGELYAEHPDVPERPGYLRWNQQPANSNVASLLSDLTNGVWKFFSFEQNIRPLDADQFSGINQSFYSNNSDPAKLVPLKTYAARLEQNLDVLKLSFGRFIEPYFRSTGFAPEKNAKLKYYESLLLADPLRLTNSSDPFTNGFRGSTTVTEQERIVGDFITIAGEMRSALLLYGMVEESYSTANQTKDSSEAGWRLQHVTTGIPFSRGQIYRLPQVTFKDYQESLKRHIDTLAQEVTLIQAKKDLRAEYKSKKERLVEAQLRLQAARVGTKVIEKARAISETYRKIADLGAEIDDLGEEIARLEQAGWKSSEGAADKRLAQVERLRDLAAAQVDALKEVTQQASEVLTSQVEELNRLSVQFKAAQQQQKEQEEANEIIGVIKAAVSVIGLALAPFTGGTSISVAIMVNKGIDTYQQLSRVNWSNFGEAVVGIGKAAESIGQIVDTGVSTFGSESAKKSLAEAKEFLNQKKSDVGSAVNETRKLLEGLGNLPKNAIGPVATALSNGYSVSIGQNGKLTFNAGDKKIIFHDEGLKNDLRSFIDAGGMIVNDLRIRNSDFVKLPEITVDQDFRRKLSESLDIVSKQLPPELFDKWKAQGEDVKKQKEEEFRNSVARLKTRVEDVNTSITDLRALGQAVAGGWLVVSDDETTVSILAPPLTGEAAQFKARLENYKAAVVSKTLTDLIGKFNGRRNEIIAAADKANTSAALGEVVLAIPGYIEQTKADAIAINHELEIAVEKFEETKVQVEISNYDAAATKAFREASDIRLQQADRRVREAALEKERAVLQIEMELLRAEQQNFEVQGAVHELRAAAIDFERTYEACLEAGVDPAADEAEELSQAEKNRRIQHNRFGIVPAVTSLTMTPPSRISLSRLLSGYEIDDSSKYSRLAVARAADDIIGLLQWLSMVSSDNDNPKPADYFARTVSHAIYAPPKEAAAEFGKMAVTIADDYDKRARKRMQVKFAEDSTSKTAQIKWLNRMPRSWSETFLRNYGVSDDDLSHVLGYIRFRFQHNNGVDDGKMLYKSLGPSGNAYYIDTNQMVVTCDDCANLHFVPIPPTKPVANLGAMSIGETGSDIFKNSNDISININIIQIKSDMREKLGAPYTLNLTGALGPNNQTGGDWTFLIIDPSAKTEEAKEKFVQLLEKNKFLFVAGYLQIDPSIPAP